MSSTQVILVRHGRSTFNAQGRYQGCSDESLLTERGQQEALSTGISLRTSQIQAIYSSPLQRAQHTAELIRSELPQSLPLQIDDALQEIDLPAWQGRSIESVREAEAAAYQMWQAHPQDFQMMGRYPVLDLYQRAQRFWQRVIPQHAGQTLLVVSHGGTLRALISTAIGLSPEHYHRLQQSNCGLSVIRFRGEYGELLAMNQTRHLGEVLPKLKEGKQGLRLLCVPSGIRSSGALASILSSLGVDFVLRPETSLRDPLAWAEGLSVHYPTVGIRTGLLISPNSTIRRLLGQILRSDSLWVPRFRSTGLTVLHYPRPNEPIIQALNTYGIADLSSKSILSA